MTGNRVRLLGVMFHRHNVNHDSSVAISRVMGGSVVTTISHIAVQIPMLRYGGARDKARTVNGRGIRIRGRKAEG